MEIAALIEEFGPEAITMVEELIKTIQQKGSVTNEEWKAIKDKGSNRASDLMLTALQKANVDPESDTGKALLAAASAA